MCFSIGLKTREFVNRFFALITLLRRINSLRLRNWLETIQNSRPSLVQKFSLRILMYFQMIVSIQHWSLSLGIRRYAFKHNDSSWLDISIEKDNLLVFGNKKANCIQKKLGLKVLLENILTKRKEFLHGFNTCMNECLNNFKMAGGITRKDLNQW